MTPEQLEEIPGVGPKTVEKISIAVNNYFASLDAVEVPDEEAAAISDETASPEAEVVGDEASIIEEGEIAGEVAELASDEPEAEEPAIESEESAAGTEESASEADTQSGDLTGLSKEPVDSDESVEELVEEGQYFEAEVVDGVENAPPADEAEVHTHERPVVEGENVPDEELPGEQR
jgi:N utilization substance protein A